MQNLYIRARTARSTSKTFSVDTVEGVLTLLPKVRREEPIGSIDLPHASLREGPTGCLPWSYTALFGSEPACLRGRQQK